MESKTKKIVIVTSIIGALVIASTAMVLRYKKKMRDLKKKIEEGNKDVLQSSKPSEPFIAFPLKKGSGFSNTDEANAVKVVQRYLNVVISNSYYLKLTLIKEDGLFGAETESTLQKVTKLSEVSSSLFDDMKKYLEQKSAEAQSTQYKVASDQGVKPFTLWDAIKYSLKL